MTSAPSKGVLFSFGILTLLLLAVFPIAPMIAISFEAGLVVGILFHSSHSSVEGEESRGMNQNI